nr:putative ribonuclease H-like domain-containing protein [Tanacetum cinerariifolium]
RALNDVEPSYPDDPSMPHLENISASPSERVFTSSYDDEGVTRSKVQKNSEAHALTYLLEKKAIGTKWVYRNKKDERGVVVRNKSAFMYGTIDEEVYVTQPPRFVDLKFPNKVKQKEDGIFISHDKYVAKILKKFDFLSVKTGSTLIETQKPLVKDEEAVDVDVTPKTLDLQAMKRIFRYLKGQPKLGLWYPKVSSFNLEAYSNSYYAGENLDKKPTKGGCQFLGRRIISWQCKKQTIVATSTIEAEYVAAAHCCGQVLWIQNQLLDYGFNLMNTKIYVHNEITICIVKNPVFHSKTNHIEIRHHFIRDAYEKKLIQVLKIHTDDNVADLLMKAFKVSSKELASPKQTALGKDESNPLIVDSLLKTIWSLMHHFIAMKHWLF